MPVISKIRFTNVIYEGGVKRYNDDIFEFDGHNGAILLENGGGKTVFIQTVLQAVLPHTDLAERKIKETLSLEGGPCHIAIEWILNERPRRYGLTAISLYLNNQGLASYKYVYEYGEGDSHSIENIPFTQETIDKGIRPSGKGEISEYYHQMKQYHISAQTFDTMKNFHNHIEEEFKIIPSEWKKIALINSAEGGVEDFFEGCRTTGQLVDRLLIPVVEEALAGNGTEDYVSSFEKHREHFKKHKQLRSRIEESKEIAKEIDKYVNIFFEFYNSKEEFTKKLELVKSIYNYTEKEEEKKEEELEESIRSRELLNKSINRLEYMEESYKLAIQERKYRKLEEIYLDINKEYSEVNYQYISNEKEHQNLYIAKLKSQVQQCKDRIEQISIQLENLDSTEDIEVIKEKIENNSGKLKYYFQNIIYKFSKNIEILENQKRKNDDKKGDKEDQLKEVEKKTKEKIKNVSFIKGKVETIEKEMKEISKNNLSNILHETIEVEYNKWLSRSTGIEEEINEYKNSIISLKEEKREISNRIPLLQEKLDSFKEKSIECTNILKKIEEKQKKILKDINEIMPRWYNWTNVYEKESSILQTIGELVEKLYKEKETILIKERESSVFLDYYGENSIFTPEPKLEEWINKWKNSFSLLELGTSYIDRLSSQLNKSSEKIIEEYPLWTISLVTTEKGKDNLTDRIKEKSKELSYPVLILSDEEARDILKKGIPAENHMILPSYWIDNIDKDKFRKWKNNLTTITEELKRDRIKKERQYNDSYNLLKHIKDFYQEYPYDYFGDIQNQKEKVDEDIKQLVDRLEKNTNEIKEIDINLEKYNETIQNLQGESSSISYKLQQANKYFNDRDLKNKLIKDFDNRNRELIDIEDRKVRLRKEIEQVKDVLINLKDELRENNDNIRSIRSKPLYEDVKNASPISSGFNQNYLEEERKILKDELNNEQKERKYIEDRLDREKGELKNKRKTLSQYINQAKYSIDDTIESNQFIDKTIDRLMLDINKFKSQLDKIIPELNESKDNLNGEKARYEVRLSDFNRKYETIMNFGKDLKEVKQDIIIEKDRIKKLEDSLSEREKRLNKDKENILEAKNTLVIKNEKYGYLKDDINKVDISKEILQDYPYNRLKIIEENLSLLQEIYNKVNNYKGKVDNRKNSFIQFCEENIKNIRLKEMAVSGIRNKIEYEEILKWKNSMNKTINRNIEIAEHEIREHDIHLQQFINYLYSYLDNVTEEFRGIPKKTRIKVEDKWKDVFIFNVPSWDENEGKEELRRHIDWMTKQLEDSSFKDEDNNEDGNLVRKSIKKWLDTKQLLQIIMKNNEIKVKCRKVTNDGKINSLPISWEKSNLWSGGEKWSKNMTLFLGILNYLAEKSQYISGSQKKHRTVIMDNPFGKASSDHVLDPVFFIAEQLGFQIIALTAHAEGKFLRDYFPIIYSCRLRESIDRRYQIFTKEKEIKYAYFKDNDPRAIDRIGEQEQLSLI